MSCSPKSESRSAFTLMEVMVAVVIIAIAFVSLYVGITQGYAVIQVSRENLRATQILQEKMETIRLFTWDQLNAAPSPYTFDATFYPADSSGNPGYIYSGTRIITAAPLSESYTNDMKRVIFRLNWTSGSVQRQREMTTLVSQYGIHNYVWSGNN